MSVLQTSLRCSLAQAWLEQTLGSMTHILLALEFFLICMTQSLLSSAYLDLSDMKSERACKHLTPIRRKLKCKITVLGNYLGLIECETKPIAYSRSA